MICRKTKNRRAILLLSLVISGIIFVIVGNLEHSTEKSFFYHINRKLRNTSYISLSANPSLNGTVSPINISIKTTEIIEDVTEVDLPEVDGYESILDSKQKLRIYCETCALVSSSGHLKGSGAGEAINNASCVIRTNNAPTQGYEEDVGNRTDIRVIGFTNLIRQADAKLMIFEEDQESMFRNEKTRTNHTIIHWGHGITNWKYVLNSHEYRMLRLWSLFYPDVNFYSITQEKTKASIKLARTLSPKESVAFFNKYFDPSTGWFVMVLATDICGEIHVYGMAPYWYCSLYPKSNTKYHYYKGRNIATQIKECEYINARERLIKSKRHRMASEKVVFETLAVKHGNIHFHYPSWNLTTANKHSVLPYFLKHSRDSSLKPTKKRYKTVVVKRITKRGNHITSITRFTKKILIK